MQFFTTALVFAATALAMPHSEGGSHVTFPVDDSTTLEQAQAKCGNDATVSCCNKATYTGDVNTANVGVLASVLQGAIGGGPGSEGLGLFGQCSDLTATGKWSMSKNKKKAASS